MMNPTLRMLYGESRIYGYRTIIMAELMPAIVTKTSAATGIFWNYRDANYCDGA